MTGMTCVCISFKAQVLFTSFVRTTQLMDPTAMHLIGTRTCDLHRTDQYTSQAVIPDFITGTGGRGILQSMASQLTGVIG